MEELNTSHKRPKKAPKKTHSPPDHYVYFLRRYGDLFHAHQYLSNEKIREFYEATVRECARIVLDQAPDERPLTIQDLAESVLFEMGCTDE